MDLTQPATCLELLQRLHPVDLEATHATLSAIVDRLLAARPAPNQHLEVLEAAREPMAFCQGELGRRYAAHPLPPDDDENATLLRVARLWNEVARSYALIAQQDAEAGTLADQRALLAQRRIHYTGQTLIEHFRAHRAVPAGCWAALHASFAAARAAGVDRIRVPDTLNAVWRAQSPLEAYVTVLLVELANPFGRSERELDWVVRWAQRFAPYCTLHAGALEHKPATYGLALGSDQGLRPLGLLEQTPPPLRFDGSALATQIQAVLAQFKRGVKPASLGLGENCPTEACARLLLSLYRPWGLGAAGRRFPRRGMRGEIELTGDWPAIGFAVEGEMFRPPRADGTPRPSLREDLLGLTFGEHVTPAEGSRHPQERQRHQAQRLGLACEAWELLDESVGGFRVQRRERGERLEHHQLAGIRPADGEQFLIADISWLMYRADGVLEAGLHVLPGVPRVIAVRETAQAGLRKPFQQAFLLPAVAALKAEASLVLPGYWFQPGRVIEALHDGTLCPLRLDKLLLRGSNYDRCSFTALDLTPP